MTADADDLSWQDAAGFGPPAGGGPRRRGKLLLVASFVLTLGAGVVVGMGLNKPGIANIAGPTSPPEQPKPPPGSWLEKELGLSDAQREQMKAIWQGTMQGSGKELADRRRTLSKDRDDALLALLTPEQRAERERLLKEYGTKLADLGKEREKLTQSAVERTKALLSPSQQAKYDQMLKDRADREPRHHGGPGSRGTGTQPSSRPSTRPFGQGGPGRFNGGGPDFGPPPGGTDVGAGGGPDDRGGPWHDRRRGGGEGDR